MADEVDISSRLRGRVLPDRPEDTADDYRIEAVPDDEEKQPDSRMIHDAEGRHIGKRNGRGRNPFQMMELKAQIATLYAQGMYVTEIARRMSAIHGEIKPNTISMHIQNLLNYWREQGLKSIDQKQALVLARLDQIEMLATEAYFASMQGKVVTNYEKQIVKARSDVKAKAMAEKAQAKAERREDAGKSGPELYTEGAIEDLLEVTDEKIKTYERFEESDAGDPRFLTIMLDCCDKRAKLWGLYIRDKEGANADQEMSRLSDEERDSRLAVVLQNAALRRTTANTNLAAAAPLGGHPVEEQPDSEGQEAV